MKENTGLTYSPKLKVAIEQIKEILKENDIAGVVALHTPNFQEYMHHVETPYVFNPSKNIGRAFRLSLNEINKESVDIAVINLTKIAALLGSNAVTFVETKIYLRDKFK